MKRTLKDKIRKETQLKFYKVMIVPTVLYGSKTCTLRTLDTIRIQLAEKK